MNQHKLLEISDSEAVGDLDVNDGTVKNNNNESLDLLVLKLNKALYGLKQASRMWNKKFNGFMLKIGFERCASDRCLYVKSDNDVLT